MMLHLSDGKRLSTATRISEREELLPKNDIYHVFESTQLIQEVLDSVQATLQNYYTAPGGAPSALDIYFCAEGDTAIAIPDMGKTIAIDAPYHSADYFE